MRRITEEFEINIKCRHDEDDKLGISTNIKGKYNLGMLYRAYVGLGATINNIACKKFYDTDTPEEDNPHLFKEADDETTFGS